jgi:hypothetical protein
MHGNLPESEQFVVMSLFKCERRISDLTEIRLSPLRTLEYAAILHWRYGTGISDATHVKSTLTTPVSREDRTE